MPPEAQTEGSRQKPTEVLADLHDRRTASEAEGAKASSNLREASMPVTVVHIAGARAPRVAERSSFMLNTYSMLLASRATARSMKARARAGWALRLP